MDDLLKKIYGHTEFNKTGHELIDLLTSYLRESSLGNDSVIRWKEPEEQLKFWKEFNLNNNDPTKLFKSIIENSIHLHNPNYMGHQLCPPAPIASLIGLVGELLNNGMAIYEMGPAATAIEKVIIDLIAKKHLEAGNFEAYNRLKSIYDFDKNNSNDIVLSYYNQCQTVVCRSNWESLFF